MQLGPGAKIADRYTVIRPLARGGVGSVWLIRHDSLRIEYALKVLNVANATLGGRLINEARVQATLQHSNVVRAVDVVNVPGGMGIVLEYVAGPSLRALLALRNLAPLEVHLLFRGLAAGVACAHRAGLVHRDLSPANVLLQVEPELVPKVTDFGLAKVFAEADRHTTHTGTTLGTPAYMAPEQVRDASRVDARADVFALGALAYEMLTGVRAFEGEDTADTLTRVKEVRYIKITERMPDAPPRMVAAIEGALVADLAARIGSVDELLERWGDDVVPPAIIASLKRDLGQLSASASTDSSLIDQTWSDTRSGQTQTSWNEPLPAEPMAVVRSRAMPRWVALAAGFGLFGLGVGSTTAWQLVTQEGTTSPASPALSSSTAPLGAISAVVPSIVTPELTPVMNPSQKAAQSLTFLVTDLSTESIKGQKDLIWLTKTLPVRIKEADRLLADIETRFPESEPLLQARFQAAMIHFLGYSYRSWIQPPQGVPEAERLVWERAIRDEIRPAAMTSLDEARARFEALSVTTHPAAQDSIWPRSSRQMMAVIDEIPR